MTLSFGLHTFGDVTVTARGKRQSQAQTLRQVVDEAVLADQVGVDFIGLGEHHRADFAISAPETVLAAIAARTRRIRLGTAVTVLSSDDPIRVFQRFSTLQALSSGRAEAIVGRGSFTESFPLFGHDLSDYERLFEEKLDLFMAAVRSDRVTWQGTIRPPLSKQTIHPVLETPLPVWIGVGGSPESVVRAVRHDANMMLAIIGGDPARFRPFVDLYGRACTEMGHKRRRLGVHSPGHIAATDAEARDQLWPHYREMYDRLGRERRWPPTTRARFDAEIDHGSLYVGAPETVARKIAKTVRTLGLDRFDLKYATGPQPHDQLLTSIRLFGEQVIPMVRDMIGARAA